VVEQAGEVRETSGGEMVRRPEKVVVVERSGQAEMGDMIDV
jgi:hypothetical protein